MKKFIALLLCMLMVFSFAACAGSTDESKTSTSTKAPNGTEAPNATEAPNDNEEQKDDSASGVIKMATNAYFKPYEYYEGEKIVGIDAEIADAIAKKLGMELIIEDMEFESILTAVKSGSVDFGMAGMTVTEDRLKEVDFSTSYANGVQVVIVKEGSNIKTVDDLSAEGATSKIGVQLGTTGDTYATGDFGAERVTQYNNANNAVIALASGDIDCVIIDNEPAKALVAANEGLKILDTTYADEDYAICVKKGNTELLNKINAAIDDLIIDGTVDTIIAKYIK